MWAPNFSNPSKVRPQKHEQANVLDSSHILIPENGLAAASESNLGKLAGEKNRHFKQSHEKTSSDYKQAGMKIFEKG